METCEKAPPDRRRRITAGKPLCLRPAAGKTARTGSADGKIAKKRQRQASVKITAVSDVSEQEKQRSQPAQKRC